MSVKHDYKPDKGLRMRRQARFYGLLVITLILIGIFGSLLAFISRTPPGPSTLALPLPTQQTPAAPDAERPDAAVLPATTPNENPDNSKPKYDFYQLLPERQVDIKEELEQVPAPQLRAELQQATNRREPIESATNATQTAKLQDKPDASPSPPKPASKPAVTPAASAGNYVVQVGSFRNQNDADKLKASIAFLGISAYIETHNEGNDGALHRVRIGPINGVEQVAQLRQRLQQNDIQSIAIKTR